MIRKSYDNKRQDHDNSKYLARCHFDYLLYHTFNSISDWEIMKEYIEAINKFDALEQEVVALESKIKEIRAEKSKFQNTILKLQGKFINNNSVDQYYPIENSTRILIIEENDNGDKYVRILDRA